MCTSCVCQFSFQDGEKQTHLAAKENGKLIICLIGILGYSERGCLVELVKTVRFLHVLAENTTTFSMLISTPVSNEVFLHEFTKVGVAFGVKAGASHGGNDEAKEDSELHDGVVEKPCGEFFDWVAEYGAGQRSSPFSFFLLFPSFPFSFFSS